MNDGIPSPFFGVDAMTSKGFAQLALRFNCVILPAWVERLGGAHFRLNVDPPLALPDTGADRNLMPFSASLARISADSSREIEVLSTTILGLLPFESTPASPKVSSAAITRSASSGATVSSPPVAWAAR